MAIPYGSNFADPTVQAAMQALAETGMPAEQGAAADGGIPFGSNLNDPRVQAALQSLAETSMPAEQGAASDGGIPFGSNLNDPRVQAALQSLAETSMPSEQGTASDSGIPFGSNLNDPRVQAALQAFAETGMPQEAGGGNAAIPFGSNFGDAKVAAALQNLEQNQGTPAASVCTVKNALNGGELAPDMHARFDLPRYQFGCEKLLNMIPLTGGGLTKRPALKTVGNAGEERQDAPDIVGRLVPWVYSAKYQFMLLFMAIKDGATPAMIYWMYRTGNTPPRESGVTLPYKGEEIFEVCCCQVGKVIYMAHPKYPPGKLTLEMGPPDPGYGYTPGSFKYEVIDYSPPPQS